MAAGVGLYGLIADGEEAAEIYSAAVIKDQAKVLFRDAELMVKASPALSAHIDQRVNNLAVLKTNSYFRPVSSELRGLDGKRPHMALIDELHEHPSDIVYEKMRAGTKARRNALIFEITNSGYDRQSVCWQHHEMSERVLSGVIENDSWFAYVCQLDPCQGCRESGHMMANPGCDECDDWRDEATWIKANPNIEITPGRKYVREQVAEAIAMPRKQNVVLRLNFCIWTEQAVRWIDMANWRACEGKIDPATLYGRVCYAGLDLSANNDLTALALFFPPVDETDVARTIAAFWCPEEAITERSRRDGVPYDQWQREGWLTATEGNVVDFDAVRRDVNELANVYNIRELAIDAWNSLQLQTQLAGDGITVVPFRQGFASMSAPAKELERLILNRSLLHDGNPVQTWCMSNVAVRQDPAGNIKPDKERSTERIDGAVALVMATGRATVHDGDDGVSVYETRGVLVL